jgi:hypothetical protein
LLITKLIQGVEKGKYDKDSLETEMAKQEGKEPSSGAGNAEGGLFNTEINKLMEQYASKGFRGVVASNEIHKLPIQKSDKGLSFIMNLNPIEKKYGGHWVAVKIDDDTIEYFDSFAEPPTDDFMKKIKLLVKKWKPNNAFQMKTNRVKHQRNNSNLCGFHAMKFLVDRYNGISFMKTTGFEIINKAIQKGKGINKFKDSIEQFGYIK